MFAWGHLKSHAGMGFSYFFYTACYFGLGWSRKWTGLVAWKHHLIALVPLTYLSGFLLVEAFDMFFPIFTPLLFLVGLFGYLAGWYFTSHRAPSLAVVLTLACVIGTWRYYLPETIGSFSEKWNQQHLYPSFVGKSPELRFESEKGARLGPEDFRGKVVLLDFWFSGCGYCIDKFKLLNVVKQHFANEPRVLVASVADGNLDDRKKFNQMLAKYPHITKPALYDPQGQFVKANGIAKFGYSFEIGLDHTSTIYTVDWGNYSGDLLADYYAERLIKQIEDKLKEIPQ